MKAIILAAGQGTRLKKYTQDLPKGMLKFMGKTIIERQIELYRKCGVEDITVVRGFAGEKIAYVVIDKGPATEFVAANEGLTILDTEYTNEDYANTNMVESLLSAKAEFTDDVILSYSDVLFSEEMLWTMMETTGDFLVAVDKDWREYWQARYGQVDFDTESLRIGEDGCISSLGLESPPLKEIDARYVGLLKFSRRGMGVIERVMEKAHTLGEEVPWQQSGKPVRKAYMTDLLQALIEEGEPVRAVPFRHGWIEFDTNEDYETACQWAQEGTLSRFVTLL